MSLLGIHLFWNETKTFPNPKDMSIHWKGLPPKTKEKETMKRFRADPFQGANHFLNFLRIHLFCEGKTQIPFPFFDPMKDFTDAPRLLFSQPTGLNGRNNRICFRPEDILPMGKTCFQSLIGFVPISIVGILGKNGLDEDIKGVPCKFPPWDSVLPFQK